ncbi:hypothetical protein PEDI_47370 [Persicobacter diffluens]|uniref:Uncharacterized protein n=1 Tax=Persicobacter diffluens TaxID=981 RepID=A0AAN4W432_9BACT|nr:hypothetical protein PEDI_47370 [Persicobacter diffluens]
MRSIQPYTAIKSLHPTDHYDKKVDFKNACLKAHHPAANSNYWNRYWIISPQ